MPTLLRWFLAPLARLRFPKLFLLTAVLFAIDLVVPDVVPFVDELLLGLSTLLLGSLRRSLGRDPSDREGGR